MTRAPCESRDNVIYSLWSIKFVMVFSSLNIFAIYLWVGFHIVVTHSNGYNVLMNVRDGLESQ